MSQENVEIVRRRYRRVQRAATSTRCIETLRPRRRVVDASERVLDAGTYRGPRRHASGSSSELDDVWEDFRLELAASSSTRATRSSSLVSARTREGAAASRSSCRVRASTRFASGKVDRHRACTAITPKPSKPPGCRSRRCRRRTWRSCARASTRSTAATWTRLLETATTRKSSTDVADGCPMHGRLPRAASGLAQLWRACERFRDASKLEAREIHRRGRRGRRPDPSSRPRAGQRRRARGRPAGTSTRSGRQDRPMAQYFGPASEALEAAGLSE